MGKIGEEKKPPDKVYFINSKEKAEKVEKLKQVGVLNMFEYNVKNDRCRGSYRC